MKKTKHDIKIKGKLKGELDTKRLYLRGLDISDKCPECGETCYHNDFHPLEDVIMNGLNEVRFICDECDYEFAREIFFNVSIAQASNKIIEYC